MRCKCDFPSLPMPEIRLYHSREKARKFLARQGIPPETIPNSDAQTWLKEDGSTAVVLYSNWMGDAAKDAAMLAHEATHIMLYSMDSIGEHEPAEEEMCYVVQAITLALCDMHFRWMGKRSSDRIEEVRKANEKGN